MNRLVDIGFIKVGFWKLDDERLEFILEPSYSDIKNNLYAFICDGEVKYVGKTTRLLKRRMYHYSMPDPTQSTNIKNNTNIIRHLKNNEAVDIFVLPDNGRMHYGQFHLNLAAALEDDIIRILQPEWNGYQEKKTITNYVKTVTSEILIPIYNFNMANTYWQRGFFNVTIAASHEFGEDGAMIKIINSNTNTSLTAIINRTANTNKVPRIMGGIDLRSFFQRNFNVGDTINYRMFSPSSMEILLS
ncbi:GIY-YIG nuclease family protein [Buttiauxella sp. A2-C2_NF]|uniref:GIY-YIG nuclease family protein n=1 Tax=Buttiauxella ferragutiae TaxID=82989 RepID=UPI001E5CEAA4|nr:GIY-YIG nuclease family protein [Buttiauxella ferragutiae]MCE0826583.1 GIY-YIG nuclease family protein [Buttiauxella ferragutiae]